MNKSGLNWEAKATLLLKKVRLNSDGLLLSFRKLDYCLNS